MILKRFFMLTLIVLISGLFIPCAGFIINSTQKLSKKDNSAIIPNQEQNIPSSWHKIDTDKLSISFPGEWKADVSNGIITVNINSMDIGYISATQTILGNPNTVYLHGKYIDESTIMQVAKTLVPKK